MKDIFDAKVMCENCDKAMKAVLVSKNGFNLRAVKCLECGDTIVHPVDKNEYENFMRLKEKEFSVKMRMVGNSYAVSIPREIVDFMKEQEKMMDDMVRLCFEEAGRISLSFNTPENSDNYENGNRRVVRAKEVKVIRGNKPVFHMKQVIDSANPKNNRTKVFRADEEKLEEEMEDEE